MNLHAHPFSSYCQKAIVAFYETDTPFELRHLEAPGAAEELAALWPLKRFPVLTDGDATIVEATAIIEYLAATRPEAAWLIPPDPVAAVEARMMDRIFDNYVNGPQQAFVYDALRPEDQRHPASVKEAAAMFDRIYPWLDERMKGREWATDHGFTLADCGAGPALFYADWTYPIPERFEALRAYRARLLARPAMARAVDEARKYRSYFPLGAPDRD
ncbi:MAG: glutathione S-transferase family protein [Brevundimonas sp.]|uniref:glutathione S-transferase family protein n=1 Tax=Brevundimonas sp. TaxID=1871086 RepID=UPI00258331CD|nr:glutathione S-transferase family protein [Brevundimonas sp.]MCV0413988.1 glutathione S-transferase family protein [Brevundimonas sp.]